MPDQLTDRARKAAEEIAVQVMRSVGAMYGETCRGKETTC